MNLCESCDTRDEVITMLKDKIVLMEENLNLRRELYQYHVQVIQTLTEQAGKTPDG